jgi:hypothetical protein
MVAQGDCNLFPMTNTAVTFSSRSSLRPACIWLAWFLGSVPAALYIVLDYVQQARRFQ